MSTDRTRFTIAVEPEVYEAFADLAQTSGVSLSRCIGDWLRDTAEAAQMVTLKVRDARRQPGEAFNAYMREVAESLPGIQQKMRETAWGSARNGLAPPSSNTGGKVPREDQYNALARSQSAPRDPPRNALAGTRKTKP
jgi:hypothetical protein